MSTYIKSVIAAIVAGLGVLITALDAGTLTTKDYLAALVAFLAALGLVYAIPNAPKAP